jgi:hypothetical protein
MKRYSVLVDLGLIYGESGSDFELGKYRWRWLAKLAGWWHVRAFRPLDEFHKQRRTVKVVEHVPGKLTDDDVRWVVNDSGELGVEINGQYFFYYKGRSLVYGGTHDDGTPIMVREVGKREFGESIYPSATMEPPYRVNVAYIPGHSFGEPNNPRYQWKPLPLLHTDP